MKMKKQLMSAVALGTLTLNVNATELQVTPVVTVAPHMSVLPLNDMGRSFVFEALEDDLNLEHNSNLLSTKAAAESLSTKIAQYDTVLMDAQYFEQDSGELKAYLEEAYALHKTIIIENANQIPQGLLKDTFPGMVSADIVVLHPSNDASPDRFYAYSANLSEPVAKISRPEAEGSALDYSSLLSESNRISQSANIKVPLLPETSLNAMNGEQRDVILTQVIDDLMAESTNTTSDLLSSRQTHKKGNESDSTVSTLNAPGGSDRYSCPQVLYDARKCRTFELIDLRYDYHFHGINLSGIAFVDYTMFKDRFNKFIGVKINGIATPTLSTDNTVRKEFFLSAVDVDIHVRTGNYFPNLDLFRRAPINRSDTTTLDSTTGLTIGIDATGGVSGSDPVANVKASATYSVSNATIQSIDDWEVTVHSPQNRDVGWRYQTKFPRIPGAKEDWIHNPGACCKARINGIKSISKYGLDFSTEAIYIASPDENAYAVFDVDVDYEDSSVYFTHQGRNVSRSDIEFLTYLHSGPARSIGLDLNWLE